MAGLFIGILALIYVVKTYKKEHVDKPVENKGHLLLQFNANRTITMQLIEALREFTRKNNNIDELMFPNITFRAYIETLENNLSTGNLSSKYLKVIASDDLTQPTIDSMVRSLEGQFNGLQDTLNRTKLFSESQTTITQFKY